MNTRQTVDDIVSKSMCCGCACCKAICPVKAISFEADKYGCSLPVIHGSLCVRCGLCFKSCPMSKFATGS